MAIHGTSRETETDGCPLIRIVGANEHGIIAISRKPLEINSTFALGLHVCLPESRQSEFVSAESMVVACQSEQERDGTTVYRVALMFSELSWRDRDLLELMAYDEGLIAPRRSAPALSDLAAGDEESRIEQMIRNLSLN